MCDYQYFFELISRLHDIQRGEQEKIWCSIWRYNIHRKKKKKKKNENFLKLTKMKVDLQITQVQYIIQNH